MPNKILHELDKPPRLNYSFLWTDYVELLCLTGEDGFFSPSHLIEAASEAEDLGVDIDQPDDVEPFDIDRDNNPIFQDNRISQRWTDIYHRLQLRKKLLTDYWPFELDGQALVRKFDNNNKFHRLYTALLVASALRYCPNDRRHEVATSLEEIGYYLFRKIMPEGWNVYPFGAHQTIDLRYTGHLFDKLSLLAKDIHGTLLVKKEDFEANDTGDGGLDVVAWNQLEDEREGFPIAFAQCGCTPEEWPLKSLEPHYAKLGANLSVMHEWATYYIMPHDLRSLDGGWEKRSDFSWAIFIDRYRILKLAQKYDITFPTWPFVFEAATLAIP